MRVNRPLNNPEFDERHSEIVTDSSVGDHLLIRKLRETRLLITASAAHVLVHSDLPTCRSNDMETARSE